jgi:cytochrome c oxidase assembly factor CtaG
MITTGVIAMLNISMCLTNPQNITSTGFIDDIIASIVNSGIIQQQVVVPLFNAMDHILRQLIQQAENSNIIKHQIVDPLLAQKQVLIQSLVQQLAHSELIKAQVTKPILGKMETYTPYIHYLIALFVLISVLLFYISIITTFTCYYSRKRLYRHELDSYEETS